MANFPIEKLKKIETPFYYYDVELLKATLNELKSEADKYGFLPHYAVKANANEKVLAIVAATGIGADCVSCLPYLKSGFSGS